VGIAGRTLRFDRGVFGSHPGMTWRKNPGRGKGRGKELYREDLLLRSREDGNENGGLVFGHVTKFYVVLTDIDDALLPSPSRHADTNAQRCVEGGESKLTVVTDLTSLLLLE
jgi:hypothetical protein